MIITVVLNPTLDKTAHIKPLVVGGTNRIQKSELDAGGKGINISRVIHSLGEKSIITGFVGGGNGEILLRILADLGLQHNFIHVHGDTRVNLKLLDVPNGITEIIEAGVAVSKLEEKALLHVLTNYAGTNFGENVFVLGGSMHASAKASFYHDLILLIKRKGARVLVDTEGKGLVHALDAAPDAIKLNRLTLLNYFKKDARQSVSEHELIAMCKELIYEKNVRMVALSLGAQGAIFVSENACAVAPALKVIPSSSVGAGDSMVGAMAFAMERNYTFEGTVRLAMACSAGAVITEGTMAPSLDLVDTLLAQVTFEYR